MLDGSTTSDGDFDAPGDGPDADAVSDASVAADTLSNDSTVAAEVNDADADTQEVGTDAPMCSVPFAVSLASAPGAPPDVTAASVVIGPGGELCLWQAGADSDGGTGMLQFAWSVGSNTGGFGVAGGSSGWRVASPSDAAAAIPDATDVTVRLVDSGGSSLDVTFRFHGGSAVVVKGASFTSGDASSVGG